MGAEVENAYVHCGFVCVGKMPPPPHTHTLTNTCAHTIWLDICTNDRVLVDSAEVPSWLGGGGRTPTTRFLQSSKLQSS